MNTTKTIARLTKSALPAAPLVVGAVSTASAAVVYTDVPDLTVSVGQAIFVDFGANGATGSVSTSNFAGADFVFRHAYSIADIPKIYFDGASSGGSTDLVNNGLAINLAPGTVLPGSNYFSHFQSALNNRGNNDANWAAGTTGYLGFRINIGSGTGYGWAQVSYNLDNSLTIRDFAYESSGGSISVPAAAIPEPASATALAALLAGSAALLKRRRQPLA